MPTIIDENAALQHSLDKLTCFSPTCGDIDLHWLVTGARRRSSTDVEIKLEARGLGSIYKTTYEVEAQ
jgi:hypothetical protein